MTTSEPYASAMQMLRIEVEGRTLTFDGTRPVRIGRAADADVLLSAMSVSRAHAELRPTPGGWMLVDAGGQLGTYVDGHRISEIAVSGTTTVQCGPAGTGSTLVVRVDQPAESPAESPAQSPAESPAGPAGAPAPPSSYGPPPSGPASAGPPPSGPSYGGPPPAASGPAPSQWAPPTGDAGAPPDASYRSFAPPDPASQQGGPQGPPAAPENGFDVGYEPTYVLASPLPGMFPGEVRQRSGPDLMVEAEGAEHRFRHPDQVTIGRLPDSSIVISDPVCSRMHLRIDPTAGGWGFTNLSREGTFIDGRRVESQAFDETTVLRLGHPTAGPEVSLVPILSSQEEQSKAAKRRLGKRLKMVGIAAAVLLLVAGTITTVLLVGGGDEGLTASERDSAKAATVLLSYDVVTPEGEGTVTGSGSIIRADGLILTNAHVAAPEAEGLSDIYGEIGIPDPEYVLVSLTGGTDFRTDDPEYRARVVSADGDLDAAVIEIYADAEGNEVDDLDLPTMPIGDSDEVTSGDDVTLLGFPGIARSRDLDPSLNHPAVTITTGVISTILDTERLGEKSEIDTDARIAPGNSGGAAVNNEAELIGVPSAYSGDEGLPVVSGRIRPINLLTDLIADAEAEVG